METVYSPAHALHAPAREFLDGQLIPYFESPSRAEIIRAAADRAPRNSLYVVGDAQYYGRDGAFKTKLKSWSFEERKSSDLFDGVDDLSLAADGSAALVRSDDAYKVIDLGAGNNAARRVSLGRKSDHALVGVGSPPILPE